MRVINSLEELAPVYSAPVVTIGNFDGVHLGHQNLIRDLVARANKIGGIPIVLTFDPHPLQVLAPNNAPLQIQTLNQKLAIFKSLGISFEMSLAVRIAKMIYLSLVFVFYCTSRIYLHSTYRIYNFFL